MNTIRLYLFSGLLAGLSGCGLVPGKLPYIGEPDIIKRIVAGKEVEEKQYPTIPNFTFINQYGQPVTQQDFAGKIYVADFFFTTCPTICPVMKKNMLQVYKAYQDTPDVRILSHSIDPEHDTPTVLKEYADDIGIKGSFWQFVTGDRDKIYEIGEQHYLVTTKKDSTAPGGYIHSGAFLLIDKEKHIRGMYDGTTEEGTKKLIDDVQTLRAEYDNP